MLTTNHKLIKTLLLTAFIGLQSLQSNAQTKAGTTEITKWQYGKTGAVSLTYDDGSMNQFRKALPVMERLKMPATFFIITGSIPGSKYHGKFIGRPVKEIIKESATVPTNDQNFFERCSATGYLGYKGTIASHTQAGSLYDSGKKEKAFKVLDDIYAKARNGELKPGYEPNDEFKQSVGSTWDDFRKDAAKGYEFASHSITHPSMPGLDEQNLLWELEKSKADILAQLGPKHTFSAECPYGFENDRVMSYALKIYPALRNRMPEPWLKEIDRASKQTPGSTDKDYIQWQRGATTKTPLPMMKLWVDTTLNHTNTWLVLVFHGIDGMGYEALPSTLLDEYFQYIKSKNDKLWVATFGDVTRYMREREHGKADASTTGNIIQVKVSHSLDGKMYYLPLTLKTYVSPGWTNATVTQGSKSKKINTAKDQHGTYVLYQAQPNEGIVTLKKG
ncbi:polysaccharide deacetylase family protein [Mucilaginibacter gossypii]|uniref:polysaccharide deacetylase family protein n=1 Tax=Mucilaginibacter gossypii TaxID=551996 RepID=UPI000DCDB1CA|nr:MULTISPECIES: polysaccharide deacetylase family protein [Mucilaginibacter]QTE37434.1 polysaccharide deacetylase family protein [Mucilaginibacter gossypii]RAV52700.1 polysaccharide deacetylase family protein [Mucilaginibacter rubeus]